MKLKALSDKLLWREQGRVLWGEKKKMLRTIEVPKISHTPLHRAHTLRKREPIIGFRFRVLDSGPEGERERNPQITKQSNY